MELAYALAEAYWGKGLIVEASKAVLDCAFRNLAVECIQCRCKIENRASARVMEKVGMKYEGTLRSSIFHRDRFWDMPYFSISRGEWLF